MSDRQTQPTEPAAPQRRRRHRGRRLLIGGVAVVALLAGAAGVARAVEEHHGGMWHMQGMPVTMIEHRADRMLSRVDATPEQQAKVHAIIEAAAKDLEPLKASMFGGRAQFAALLTAPQIDRAAVEHLRVEHLAAMDQATQRISRAAEDAADVLTPDQRQKLKQVMGDMEQHEHN